MDFLGPMPTTGELGTIAIFIGIVAAVVSSVSSVATLGFFVIEMRRLSREKNQEERELSNLGTERRRSAETNVLAQHRLELTPMREGASPEPPFMLSFLALKNEGDGPVDIWASLLSARVLSSEHKPGIGLRSRDVEWETDLLTYYWNVEDTPASLTPPFAGISTTKNMLPSVDQFVRLAPHEVATLRRTDGINDVAAFTAQSPFTLLSRVFFVARGYPLGEVMRQIGGGPPDPVVNASRNQLLFQALAQPNVNVWRDIQQAILLLNRFSFRCASGEPDPLSLISEPDGWRFFLLHYSDFLAPDILQLLAQANDRAREEEFFGKNLTFPRDLTHDPRFIRYCQECAEQLKPMLVIWRKLRAAIALCKTYSEHHYQESHVLEERLREIMPLSKSPGVHVPGEPEDSKAVFAELAPHLDEAYVRAKRAKRAKPGKSHGGALGKIPDDGYAVRIHYDVFYRERWLAFMEQGYVVSKPFYRETRRWLKRHPSTKFTEKDIPADPRALEPYVMRTHYFATSVDARTGEVTQSPTFGDTWEARITNVLPGA